MLVNGLKQIHIFVLVFEYTVLIVFNAFNILLTLLYNWLEMMIFLPNELFGTKYETSDLAKKTAAT